MPKPKTLRKTLVDNFVELWLGALLFVGLPLVVALYTNLKGFIATTIITQTIVLILFVYKGNR